MVGAGLLMILISVVSLIIDLKGWYDRYPWYFRLLPLAISLPYLANTGGWLLTEVGRYPWVVYGLVKQTDGVSKAITGGMLLTSLIGFSLLYTILIIATIYLMIKHGRAGPSSDGEPAGEDAPSVLATGAG